MHNIKGILIFATNSIPHILALLHCISASIDASIILVVLVFLGDYGDVAITCIPVLLLTNFVAIQSSISQLCMCVSVCQDVNFQIALYRSRLIVKVES